MSPGGENLLDFLQLLQVLSTYDGDLEVIKMWRVEGTLDPQTSAQTMQMAG